MPPSGIPRIELRFERLEKGGYTVEVCTGADDPPKKPREPQQPEKWRTTLQAVLLDSLPRQARRQDDVTTPVRQRVRIATRHHLPTEFPQIPTLIRVSCTRLPVRRAAEALQRRPW